MAALAYQSFNGQFGGNLTVVDMVPANMLHLIDPHWHQFAPINPLQVFAIDR